ncbi:MAG TPA: hypothetical protein ENJ32_05980 [Crenotrichaceae bacterium]|nr:hypothetical protein [Crenotrichaceae bacterium]
MIDKNFPELIQDEFSYLVENYGFHCVSATVFDVRFESDTVFVDVRYDANRSYEIGIEVGQKNVLFDGKERPFNLGEILRLRGVAEKEGYKAFQAADSVSLINCISRLSSWLEIYAVDFLQNDRFSFKRLSDFREKECDQYELETKLSHIRREVQIAWSNKDYLKVLELYQPVESFLSEVEKKKLAFAQRQITKTPN